MTAEQKYLLWVYQTLCDRIARAEQEESEDIQDYLTIMNAEKDSIEDEYEHQYGVRPPPLPPPPIPPWW